ncbi:L,D-transpeptidase [Candidatus Synechococcus calcipolaris G9]|uniref:L,D-transpeptidase n=1 Tax=Candidatus Synechococcus calcipolaris G9 TaxID=1497997 RepID=A0ABT6EYK0_9SYNE|nr:L,D-transpeptidase [Candidatus Synechococcus calcipolaris]MDG2990869.1 L,D-transpeptidase [Candidatus Synechococcus calcipolaris G9]
MMLRWLQSGILASGLVGLAALPGLALPLGTAALETAVSRAPRTEPNPLLLPDIALLELPALREASPFLPTMERKLVLRLSDRRVYLYEGEQVLASYPVAIGRAGWETPQGSFQVSHKVVDPIWQNPFNGNVVQPGPNNPLGDRLIVFAPMGNKGFVGFHGTTNESLIGQAVSHGCVRMKNNDIRALFEKVEVGMAVIVQP